MWWWLRSLLPGRWSQSTSISFVPGFVCWLPFASPFPSAPGLAVGTLLAPLLWSFTSGASSTVGFGLLRTGLHTSSSSWGVREECVGKWKASDLVAANGSKNYILNIHLHTCILAMRSATLTMGSWVMPSLLCAFILLFIQPMLSLTHFSTVLMSSAPKCRYRSSWETVWDKNITKTVSENPKEKNRYQQDLNVHKSHIL